MSAPRKKYLIGKSKPFKFRSPKNSSFLIWSAKLILPLILRLALKVFAVEVKEEDLRRLKELKGHRVVLTPSHSGGLEPFVLLHLSKVLGEEFNFLAAKGAFESFSFAGWLIQRLGAYSIVQGIPDKSSFRMTKQLLIEGKRWLVIFPEGFTCWQNDIVMPFQQGVAQLAFWAYEDLDKRGELPSLYFVPIAIKYIYLRDMRNEIESSLQRLESKLFSLSKPKHLNLYNRLRRLGEAVLSANEKEFNVRPNKDASLNERIQHIKELIVSRVSHALGVSSLPEQPLLERIRYLLNTIDHIVYSESGAPEYVEHLLQKRQQELQVLYDDLCQVLHFVALYEGYVSDTLTPERFLDVLGLFELEVLGRGRIWGPRKALVKIGEPINLKNYYLQYQTNKRDALRDVTTTMESSVGQMLAKLSHQSKPIE